MQDYQTVQLDEDTEKGNQHSTANGPTNTAYQHTPAYQSAPQTQGETKMSKRIRRSRQERLIAGVAGGVATYFNIDPLLVRLGFVVLAFFNGFGALVYAILWFLVPNEDTQAPDSRGQIQENVNEVRGSIQQFIGWIRSLFR
jgi:phage shock protein C